MATKDESLKARRISPQTEHATPKKRRKVNHGRYDIATSLYFFKTGTDVRYNSVYLLPALGKPHAFFIISAEHSHDAELTTFYV